MTTKLIADCDRPEPDVLANAGAVRVWHLRWLQNRCGEYCNDGMAEQTNVVWQVKREHQITLGQAERIAAALEARSTGAAYKAD